MNAITTSYIKAQLKTNAAWAIRALVKIYTLQTNDEQECGSTKYRNNAGFSGCDSAILSSFAEQVNRGRSLSPKQMAILFRRIHVYWKQIVQFIPEGKLADLEQKASVWAAEAK